MELRQLKHFVAIAEQRSFTRAATVLCLTPQALSKSISGLEDDLGVRLLDRTSRHVELTPHGELLLSHARNITAEASQYLRQLDDILGIKSGRVMIGAGPTAAGLWVAKAVQHVSQRLPKVHLSVTDGNSSSLLPMLLRGQLDVLVCVANDELGDPLIAEETLFVERVAVMTGPQHPLAGRTGVNLGELARFPWLVGWKSGGIDERIAESFRAHGIRPPVPRLETNSVMFARAMLRHNELVAVLPQDLFATDVKAGVLATVDVQTDASGWSRPFKLVYRHRSTRSPATMAFIDALRKVVGEHSPTADESSARSPAIIHD